MKVYYVLNNYMLFIEIYIIYKFILYYKLIIINY